MSKELEKLLAHLPENIYQFLKQTIDYKIINETLKRNEPMLIKSKRLYEDMEICECPKCKRVTSVDNFCSRCGQSLERGV